VNRQVQLEKEQLERTSAQLTSRADGLANLINSNSHRINVIASMELPQQQRILDSLQSERPGVQAQYNNDLPNANRLEAELDSFERRVGWFAKVQAVSDSTQSLSQRRSELNNSLSLKTSTESVISRCISERSRLNNQLAAQQSQKSQSENRLVQVRQSLQPFEQEKSRIESSASDLQNKLAGEATQFESQLPL
jgi:chromosome segregation ATPase